MVKKRPTSAKVRTAIAELRKDYELGKRLLKEHEPGSRFWPDMQDVCKRFKRPAHQIRTLRAFAARYSGPDLERLCRQSEQHNRAVGLTAIRHLVKFDDRCKRARFQSRLIAGAWSNARIVAELKRELRLGWKGGRKPHVAADVPGVLLQLHGFAVAWRRWSERFADEGDDQVEVRPADFDPDVWKAMQMVTKAFAALNDEVSRQQEEADRKPLATGRRRRSKPKMRDERP